MSTPKGELEILREVVNKVQLLDTRLTKLSMDSDLPSGCEPLVDQLDIGLEPSYSEHPENILKISIAFDISGRNKKSPEVTIFTIKGTFDLFYSINFAENDSKEGLEIFCNKNGPFNAWPYLREIVQSFTCRMGIPPVTIPVYKYSQSLKMTYDREMICKS